MTCRWERLGDMAILPAGSLTSSHWRSIGPGLWSFIASSLGSRRIARQASTSKLVRRQQFLKACLGFVLKESRSLVVKADESLVTSYVYGLEPSAICYDQ